VIAFRRGAVPELVEDGRTGFIVDDVEEMADAIGRLGGIDRASCRLTALDHFDVNRMIDRYEALYRSLASERGPREIRDTA
jgi:glycosyltransferase involved in cell wall biosynthesis